VAEDAEPTRTDWLLGSDPTPVVAWNYHPFSFTMTAAQRERMRTMLNAAVPRCDKPHLQETLRYAQPCMWAVHAGLCGFTSDIQTLLIARTAAAVTERDSAFQVQWACERHMMQTYLDMWQNYPHLEIQTVSS
jgi:hypothetical protein